MLRWWLNLKPEWEWSCSLQHEDKHEACVIEGQGGGAKCESSICSWIQQFLLVLPVMLCLRSGYICSMSCSESLWHCGCLTHTSSCAISGNVFCQLKKQQIQLFDSNFLICINVYPLRKWFPSALFKQVNTLFISLNFCSFNFVVFVFPEFFRFFSSVF